LGEELGCRKAAIYTGQHEHRKKKRGNTSVTLVGFEPKVPLFEGTEEIRALDHVAAVNGIFSLLSLIMIIMIIIIIIICGRYSP
jgi:hypothetical protein